ncbi:uncharacterized protein [Antedon mediterranea]|uniref:uncharacterized protein n=1 Tax=Antedon mediterranea TaxID=105859 RepID=UPI003AF60974
MEAIYRDLTAGRISLTFDGQVLEADIRYMMLDGEPYAPENISESSGFPIWAIVLIVVISILMMFILLASWFKVCHTTKYNVSKVEKMSLTDNISPVKISSFADNCEEETSLTVLNTSGGSQPLISMDDLQLSIDQSRPSFSRSKSPGFNTPCRTPEILVRALPPGFADGETEQDVEDRASMHVMICTSEKSLKKIGLLSVNLAGTLSTLRADLQKDLGSKLLQLPFAFLSEGMVVIDGASEKKMTVHETYASDSVLIRYIKWRR